MYYKKTSLSILLLLILITACVPNNTFQKIDSMPSYGWTNSNVLNYTFNIKDTSAKYNVTFILRHRYAYPFCNIWLKLFTTFPNKKKDTTTIELPLATASGQWMGKTFFKNVEQKINIGPNASAMKFQEKGMYNFQIQQIMRQDTLKDILASGLNIEKVEK